MDREHQGDIGAQVEALLPQLKRPPMYRVLIHNDDYTPMEFVVHILQNFFAMGQEKATRIMLQVHNQGHAECGIYSRDIADTKVRQVNQYAQQNDHPLKCTAEKVE